MSAQRLERWERMHWGKRRRAAENPDLWNEIIRNNPQLTAAEEQELAREQTPQSIRRLFECNIKLALQKARKKLRRGYPDREYHDFVQEALSGLYKAAVEFKPLGFRFSTFASFWIRQKLNRYGDEGTRVIRVPAHVQKERTLYPDALSLDLEDQYRVMADRRAVLQECDVSARLDEAIRQLPPQLAEVLRMRFGLHGYEPMKLRQIGEKFQRQVKVKVQSDDGTVQETTAAIPISRERVRQLEVLAIQELRKPWAREILGGLLP